MILVQQVHSDEDEQNAAAEPNRRHFEQAHDEQREHDTKHDRDGSAENGADAPLLFGKIAAGERDDDGIVARQQQIDPDDLQRTYEGVAVFGEAHGMLAPRRERTRRDTTSGSVRASPRATRSGFSTRAVGMWMNSAGASL